MKVENRLLGYFFNHFDFFVRFFYSNLHLNKLFKNFYISNFYNIDYKFEELRKIMTGLDISFENKVCLELGPGNSYITAYNLLLNGAKKVILVDKFPRRRNDYKTNKMYHKEIDYVKDKYKLKNLFFLKNDNVNSKYIEFIDGDIAKIHFKKQLDFVLSFRVLEHIRNVKEVVSKFSDIIKHGGFMYHSIDLRDHYNFNKPFLFYKYSCKTWNRYLTREGVSYTNRLRYDDYMNIFFNNNFFVLFEDKEYFYIDEDQYISSDFQNKCISTLKIGILSILLKNKII